MFPFESAHQTFEVAGIVLPRYGCATVNEIISFDGILSSHAELLACSDDQSAIIAALHLNPVIAALVLISRHKPNWSLETVINHFTLQQIGELADFALGERRRWKEWEVETEPVKGNQPAKPTDWAEIYWMLQLHYCNEARFSAERFGDCPIAVIEQAIAAATRLELERASRAAVPISLLGFYTLSAQGLKTLEPGHFNPFERLLGQQDAAAEIDPAIARTLVGLIDSGGVPSWAIALIPLGKMRLAAKG